MNELKPIIVRIDDYLCHVDIVGDINDDGQLPIEYKVMTVNGNDVVEYDHDYITEQLSNFFTRAIEEHIERNINK